MGLNLLPRYHIKIWAELQIRSMRHLKGTIKRFCNVTELQVIRFPGMLGEVGFLQRKFQVYSGLAAKLGYGIIMAYGSFAFLQLLITKSPKILSTYCKQTCGGC